MNNDFKSILQEVLQKRKIEIPTYVLVGSDGPAHCTVFQIACMIPELGIKVTAQGRNKKEASQYAAEKALAQIKLDNLIFME